MGRQTEGKLNRLQRKLLEGSVSVVDAAWLERRLVPAPLLRRYLADLLQDVVAAASSGAGAEGAVPAGIADLRRQPAQSVLYVVCTCGFGRDLRGVAPERINTTIDFGAAKEYGAKAEGSEQKNAAMLSELAAMVASGELEGPIAATFRLVWSEEIRQCKAV